MRKAFIGIVLLGLVGAMCGGYWYWTGTPSYAIAQIGKTVADHDLPAFRRFVDLDTVASRLVDDAMSDIVAEAKAKGSGGGIGDAMGLGLLQLLKPRLVSMFQEQAERFVETGSFEQSAEVGRDVNDATTQSVSLHSVANGLGVTMSTIEDVEEVERDGQIALVRLRMRPKTSADPVAVDLKMRRNGRSWQVAEIANFVPLLKSAQENQRLRLEELNEPIRKAISEGLVVHSVSKDVLAGRFSFDNKIRIRATFENKSQREIVGFKGVVNATDESGSLIKTIAVEFTDKIPVGMRYEGEWRVDANPFIAADKTLYETPSSRLTMKLQVNEISFADGDGLRIFTALP